MLSKARQSKIINENFQLLAAICFQGYLWDGKGIFLLSEPQEKMECTHWLVPSFLADVAGIYVGERSSAFLTIFRGDWKKLSPVIAEYNPNQLGLVAFYERKNNSFSVFFLEDPNFTPVNSYQFFYPRLIEFFFQR